jgi:hypothetical protein
MSQPGIYRSGQHIPTKTANRQSSSIPDDVKALLGWLRMDMAVFKRKIESYHKRSHSGVPIAAQNLITPYCKLILEFLKTYKVKPGRIVKSAELSVEKLRQNLMQFDGEYTKLKQHVQIAPRLHALICELNGAVLWFVKQYVMVINSYPVTTPVPINGTQQDWADFIKAETIALRGLGPNKIMRNRPKNWAVRDAFRTLTLKHQQVHGLNKFMPFKSFSRALVSINKQQGNHQNKLLEFSEKSYYHLKKAWKDKTFDNVV